MKETIFVRINDHQQLDGIQEYSIEVSAVGKYSKHIIGASQGEMESALLGAFQNIMTMLEIPRTISREQYKTAIVFTDTDGTPQPISKFAAVAKLAVEAEVYRNGKVVPPEDDIKYYEKLLVVEEEKE